MAASCLLLIAFASRVASQVVERDGKIIITLPSPSPPPPPLSLAQPHWVPLYFLLGLIGLYVAVMALVLLSSKYERGTRGEGRPLTSNGKPPRPMSWMELQRSGVAPPSLESIDRELKKGFVRKVYSILGTQLLLTVAINVGMLYAAFYRGDPQFLTSFGLYYIRQQWIYLLSFILLLVVVCGLFSLKNRYPANYILLFFFTSLLAFTLSRCAMPLVIIQVRGSRVPHKHLSLL